MRPLLHIVIILFSTWSWGIAQTVQNPAETTVIPPAWESILDGTSDNLNDFLWHARPVVVFADSPQDPRFAQQMALLRERAGDLAERDVIVLTDTDPDTKSPLRTTLRPRGFTVVIVGKDGVVRLRKAVPWNVRELTRVIDKTPLRQREVRERRQP